MDTLAYGTHYLVDGMRADREALASEETLDATLQDIATLVGESAPPRRLLLRDEEGASAAFLLPESHLLAHAFPALGVLHLHVFTRRKLPLEELRARLEHRFRVGRFVSRLGTRSRPLPDGEEALERALAGDRAYARTRLDASLLG